MYLPDFDYYAPPDLSEACRLLREFGSRAKILAGGTDLLHKMKHEEFTPEVIISLKNLSALREIRSEPGQDLLIGALATQNEIANSSLLQEKYRSISEAAWNMANNQIRHMGTIGGNIVNAVPSADLPPILIVLGARITLVSTEGERTVPLEEFFLGVHKTVIRDDEILTQVIVPAQTTTGSTYIRFGLRKSGALAIAGVAVAVTMEGEICRSARIVLAAAAPLPLRARQAEQVIVGQRVTPGLLEQAGLAAAQESRPRSSIRGSTEYRRDLIRVLTRRALHKAIQKEHI
ncbi:carbon monoxide dehydrogenase medium chain [Peptococcaceae bacterium CEB3]|nr:carbon monoxide dehydrogenase medium chain [Peptococcaceae bacterium CEB3]